MNRTECARLIANLLANYHNADVPSVEALVSAWALVLGDVPYPAAEAAVVAHIRTSTFFPTAAEILALVAAGSGIVPTTGDAWAMVQRHLRDYGPGAGAVFTGPEPVRQAVNAMGGWWVLRMSETPVRDQAAFVRVYETYAKRAIAEMDFGEALAALGAGRAEPALPVAAEER